MNKNSCEKYQDMLVAYADGELDESLQNVLREHLSVCPECCELLNLLGRSMDAFSMIQAKELVMADDITGSEGVSGRKKKNPWFICVAAAILAISIGIAYYHFVDEIEVVDPINSHEIASIIIADNAKDELMVSTENELTDKNLDLAIFDLRIEVLNATRRARLLAMADMHAEKPSGIETAISRYKRIIKDYPETKEAKMSSLRIDKLNINTISTIGSIIQ